MLPEELAQYIRYRYITYVRENIDHKNYEVARLEALNILTLIRQEGFTILRIHAGLAVISSLIELNEQLKTKQPTLTTVLMTDVAINQTRLPTKEISNRFDLFL